MTPKLSDRVERLTAPDREIDAEVAHAIGINVVDHGHPLGVVWYDKNGRVDVPQRFTASIDAALKAVPEELRKSILISIDGDTTQATIFRRGDGVVGRGDAATPAIALLTAALRARGL